MSEESVETTLHISNKLFNVAVALSIILLVVLGCQNSKSDKSSTNISWYPDQACYFLQDFAGLEPSSASKKNNFVLDGEVFCSSNFKEFSGSRANDFNTVQYFAEGKDGKSNQLTLKLFISGVKGDTEARKFFADASLALFKKALNNETPEDLKKRLQEGTPQKWEVGKTMVEIQKDEFTNQITGDKGYKLYFIIGSLETK